MNLELLYDFAIAQVGTPYQWGGEGPSRAEHFGWDCSGLARAIGRAAGLKADVFMKDCTAHDLFTWFSNPMNGCVPAQVKGAFAFFGSEARASHVGWMVDSKLMLSAASGGPWCLNREIARQRCAAVKIQPIKFYRIPPLLGVWYPPYPFES